MQTRHAGWKKTRDSSQLVHLAARDGAKDGLFYPEVVLSKIALGETREERQQPCTLICQARNESKPQAREAVGERGAKAGHHKSSQLNIWDVGVASFEKDLASTNEVKNLCEVDLNEVLSTQQPSSSYGD